MQPADRDLRVLDLLARQAADAIERIQIEEARLEAASRSQQLLDVIPAGVCGWQARVVMITTGRRWSCGDAHPNRATPTSASGFRARGERLSPAPPRRGEERFALRHPSGARRHS